QNAAAVPIERQPFARAAVEQDLLRSRRTDVGKLLERLFCLRVGLLQDGVEIAPELIEGDARDLEPPEDTRLGPPASQLRELQQHRAVRRLDLTRIEPHLLAEALEDGGAAMVRQQVAGVLPEDELERSAGGRQDGVAVMTFQRRDELLEFGHAPRSIISRRCI